MHIRTVPAALAVTAGLVLSAFAGVPATASTVSPLDTSTTSWLVCPVPYALDYQVQVVFYRASTVARPYTVSFARVGSIGLFPPKVNDVTVVYHGAGESQNSDSVEDVSISPSTERWGLVFSKGTSRRRSVKIDAVYLYLQDGTHCATGGAYSG